MRQQDTGKIVGAKLRESTCEEKGTQLMDWRTPAWQKPIAAADRVELLSLADQTIVPEVGWPESFWPHVSERHLMKGPKAAKVAGLFQRLAPSTPARCHLPRWGLAFYDRDSLLFTVTLCYRCSNAYVYTAEGKDLRAFEPNETNAASLRKTLEKHLPLPE